MDGNAEISWHQLRMRMAVNASFAHGFRILRYTAIFKITGSRIILKPKLYTVHLQKLVSCMFGLVKCSNVDLNSVS